MKTTEKYLPLVASGLLATVAVGAGIAIRSYFEIGMLPKQEIHQRIERITDWRNCGSYAEKISFTDENNYFIRIQPRDENSVPYETPIREINPEIKALRDLGRVIGPNAEYDELAKKV